MTQIEALLGDWEGRPLDDVLRLCRDTVEEADYGAVERWRAAGGKVVGHFQVYFPCEIAHAAGMLPVKIRGAPIEPTSADSRFGSYLCSILKTSLELGLSKTLEVDAFFSHPICDAARNLAAIWGRNFDHPSQILYLPQNANSAGSASYLADEYRQLAKTLQTVGGRPVDVEALRASVRLYNTSRALVRELYDLKRDAPWNVNAEDAYALVAVGGFIPVEEHIALLQQVLPELRTQGRNKEDRVRIVFEGAFCEQPPLDLIRLVGRSCYVVDDDFLIGLRWITEDVPLEPDPFDSLAESYLERSSYSPVQHDNRKPKEKMLLDRVQRSGAEAVVLTAAKMCEPGLEEQVAYVKALDEKQIPYFLSEFEEGTSHFGSLELQVETFVESLLFA